MVPDSALVRSEIASTDPDACANEPIHIPGSLQPHGVLVCADPVRMVVEQVGGNGPGIFGRPVDQLLGQPLAALIGTEAEAALRSTRPDELPGDPALSLGRVRTASGGLCHVSAHEHDGALIVEFEPVGRDVVEAQGAFPFLRRFMRRFESAGSIQAMTQGVAEAMRAHFGYDRVLVYQFDPEWNGQVVAEAVTDELPPYLDLRFPASDIPRQARELYRLSRIRQIPAVDYAPVPLLPLLNPRSGRPLDLTFASLRSVSPMHLQYMRNMGVAASMSVSIVVRDRLWGLISCHHRTPKRLSFEQRAGCEQVGRVLSLQIEARDEALEASHRLELRGSQVRLLASMAEQEDYVEGMLRNAAALLGLAHADGAAVLVDGRCERIGTTPDEPMIREIADWLRRRGSPDVFHTDCLSELLPSAEAARATASGLLAIAFSRVHRSFVMWFRREQVRTVRWAGDPTKPPAGTDAATALHPRRSFELWKQVVERRSAPWRTSEIDAAGEFRNAIVDIVLRKAEELAQLASHLQLANRELEAFSYSVSHDLRAPLRHIAGYADLLEAIEGKRMDERSHHFLGSIIESARYAGTLLDNLLAFSQMGRAALQLQPVSLRDLVDESVQSLRLSMRDEFATRPIEWRIGALPVVQGDVAFLRLAVENLLANAVKYTRGRTPAVIEIGANASDAEHLVFVRDNGVGFDMQYAGKLFGVFQRLHRMEEFEGTGIGLANVRRIVTRHGGRTWAEGAPGRGATFWFSLPRSDKKGPDDA